MRKGIFQLAAVVGAFGLLFGLAGCDGDNKASDSEAPVELLADFVDGESLAIFTNTNDVCTSIRDLEFVNTPIRSDLPVTQFNDIVLDQLIITYDNLTQDDIVGVTVPEPLFLALGSARISVNGTETILNVPFLTSTQKFSPPLDGSGAPFPFELRANMVVQGHLEGDPDVIVTSELSIGVTVFDATPTPDLDGDGCPDTDQDDCACG